MGSRGDLRTAARQKSRSASWAQGYSFDFLCCKRVPGPLK